MLESLRFNRQRAAGLLWWWWQWSLKRGRAGYGPSFCKNGGKSGPKKWGPCFGRAQSIMYLYKVVWFGFLFSNVSDFEMLGERGRWFLGMWRCQIVRSTKSIGSFRKGFHKIVKPIDFHSNEARLDSFWKESPMIPFWDTAICWTSAYLGASLLTPDLESFRKAVFQVLEV